MPKDNQIRFRLGLTALLLVACLMLSVGTAFARYRTKLDPFEYLFKPEAGAVVSLWGLDEAGNLTSLPGSWSVGANGSSLAFGVSNEKSKQDLNFAVRIAVSSNVSNGSALPITLVPSGEETGYIAKAIQIRQGSQLYEEFGAGWLYRFMDEEGKEMTWTLDGGKLSVFRGELMCTGNVTEENSGLLQMQVVAAP